MSDCKVNLKKFQKQSQPFKQAPVYFSIILRMTFTQNEKKPTDDNENRSIVCYRPLIVLLFFTFKTVGQ